MRPIIATLIFLACTACTHQPIDNPYRVFKPDMLFTETKRVIIDANPTALDSYDEGVAYDIERGFPAPKEFNALSALFNTTPFQPDAILLFRNDHLKALFLQYALLPHEERPGRSENECVALFRRVVIAQMTDAFGNPTNSIIKPKGDRSREETVEWKSNTLTATAYMYIDGTSEPDIAEPRCGVINSKIFFGSESEQEAFMAEMSAPAKH